MGRFIQAEPKDIVAGNTVHIEDDSGTLIGMRIEEVLKPSDQWKAFCGDDGCRYGLDGCFIKTPEPKEENTDPRRCDLCQFEDGNCPDGPCHSGNGLVNFKPKGEVSEDTGCGTCPHWKAVKIGKYCPDCAQALG